MAGQLFRMNTTSVNDGGCQWDGKAHSEIASMDK